MKKLVLTLTVLGLLSALVLSFVYEWTMPHITAHQKADEKEAILAVLPQSDDYQEVEKHGLLFYEGNKNNEVAIIFEGSGFQDTIRVMVGADPVGKKVYGIRILDHSETPGLGAFIEGDKYLSNFEDKPFGTYQVVKRPVQDTFEVEAISGATISSVRVAEIVERAVEKIRDVYGGAG